MPQNGISSLKGTLVIYSFFLNMHRECTSINFKSVRLFCRKIFGLFLVGIILTAALPLKAADKIIMQLRWDHQFQFAGYYAALWQGYYTEEGLDVEIRSAFEPGGKFHSAINEVAEGHAHFGTGASDILTARNEGRPLVIVSTIFQQSPVAFFAKREMNVNSPVDLTRLRVGTRGPNGIANVELRSMLRAENIDPSTVNLLKIKEKIGIFDLAKGNLDVASGFTISAGWYAKQLKLDLTKLRPSAYGVDFYGSALFTRQEIIDKNPKLVRRFTVATLRGWQYALTHGEEIADRITKDLKRKIPVKDLKGFNRFQIKPVSELTLYPIVKLGNTNSARWQRMHAALKDNKMVSDIFEADKFIFDPKMFEQNHR